MKSNYLPDKQREIISEKISLIQNQLYQYVCPIFDVNEKGELSLYGSSVLLNIDTKYFLITAAHVIAPSKRNRQYLWGADGAVLLSTLANSSIHITSSTTDDHKEDKVDLAHIQLVDDAPNILKEFSFLNLANFELNSLSSEIKTYIAIGYPHSQTKRKYKKPILDQRYLSYLSSEASESVYKELDIPPQVYLALVYDQNRIIDLLGNYQKAVTPFGISGGGIWALPNEPPINNTSKMGKLVAIVLAHQALNKVIWGIKIPVVLEMIRSFHPELNDKIPKSNLLNVIMKNV
jgi:hypothetical protein